MLSPRRRKVLKILQRLEIEKRWKEGEGTVLGEGAARNTKEIIVLGKTEGQD